MSIKKGQLIKISYEDREFDVIVIDPNGIGRGQPSVGFGFRMMERYAGIPNDTLSRWVVEGAGVSEKNTLKLPSGKTLRVLDIPGSDGNNYRVVEASDWFDLAFDLLENPGRTSKTLKGKLLNFIKWFTIKGFYAEAYNVIKGGYSPKDSRALSTWMQSRIVGIPIRNKYTDFLQANGCNEGYEYAYWTDYLYEGVLGMSASQMKRFWKLVEGDAEIGRNYIPEAKGIEAIAYCENMAVELFIDDLQKAHDDAIDYTKRKFFGGLLGRFE